MNADAATGSMWVRVPDISTVSRIEVIGVLTDAASVPVITQTAKTGIACAESPHRSCPSVPNAPPASAPTARIGMKMPPGTPEPKLVLVNRIFTTSRMHSIKSPVWPRSAVCTRFEPPPSTSGSHRPTGRAIAMAIIGRNQSGSLPYKVWNPSRERFISEPTSPAMMPSGINHM